MYTYAEKVSAVIACLVFGLIGGAFMSIGYVFLRKDFSQMTVISATSSAVFFIAFGALVTIISIVMFFKVLSHH